MPLHIALSKRGLSGLTKLFGGGVAHLPYPSLLVAQPAKLKVSMVSCWSGIFLTLRCSVLASTWQALFSRTPEAEGFSGTSS